LKRCLIRGGRSLYGSIRVQGAKNAALPILAAALLGEGPSFISGVPRIRDVYSMGEILAELGARVSWTEEGVLVSPSLSGWEVPESLSRKLRSSVVLLGVLLGRFGRVKLARPGGCAIGARPIDLHLKALRALGASFREEGGYLWGEASRLRGALIHFDQPSVGATENALLAAVAAEGETVIENAAREPEIADLASFLCAMGASVSGAGTSVIRVRGGSKLRGVPHYRLIPDRIEAGTYLLAGAVTRGEVWVEGVVPLHLEPLLAKLREGGVEVFSGPDRVGVRAASRPRAVDVVTMPHPGFPTDLQNPFLVLLALSRGVARVTERIFEDRFRVVPELRRLGAEVEVSGRQAVVRGVEELWGAEVEAPADLRGAAALLLAGLSARGETVLASAGTLDRGYERWTEKLGRLGARVEVVPAGSRGRRQPILCWLGGADGGRSEALA